MPATLLKKTVAQVFSCQLCEISKNTVLTDKFLLYSSPRWDDIYTALIWNFLSRKVSCVAGKRLFWSFISYFLFSTWLAEGCNNSILLYKITWILCNFMEFCWTIKKADTTTRKIVKGLSFMVLTVTILISNMEKISKHIYSL